MLLSSSGSKNRAVKAKLDFKVKFTGEIKLGFVRVKLRFGEISLGFVKVN